MTQDELRRRIVQSMSGVQTGSVSHSETTETLLQLVATYSDQRVVAARIDEQEFMANSFAARYARTDFSLLDFTNEMSAHLEDLKAEVAKSVA